MKHKFLVIAAFAVAFPLVAQAKTLKFPSDAPIASIAIPNSWGPKETETGVDATSSDSAVYFSIDIATDESIDKTVDVAIDFLTNNGVTLGEKKKESDPTEINGMTFTTIDYDGTDKDGPVDVGLGFLSPVPGKVLIVTYWGSKETQDAHEKEVINMLASIKPLK